MKYERIRQQLLSEIATGAFTIGEQFPSENDLVQRFSVSRMTARRALKELENEGYISRTPGKGNILQKPQHGQGFFTVRPFKNYAEYIGAKADTQVLKAELKNLTQEGQKKLDVERAIFVHRLRILDNEIIIDEQRYLVYEKCKTILQEDLRTQSIHELLVEKYKLPLTRVWQQLHAVSLNSEEATRLDCDSGAAAFLLERVTYSFDEPISWVKYLMRGDKYSFENEFPPQMQSPIKNHKEVL